MNEKQELLLWEILVFLLNSDIWKSGYEDYGRQLFVKANEEYGKVSSR